MPQDDVSAASTRAPEHTNHVNHAAAAAAAALLLAEGGGAGAVAVLQQPGADQQQVGQPPPHLVLQPPAMEEVEEEVAVVMADDVDGPSLVLLADIGGTNGRFKVCQCEDLGQPIAVATLRTQQHAAIGDLVISACGELGIDAKELCLCCFAVCGPVLDGEAHCIFGGNREWVFTEHDVRAALCVDEACSVTLINDFVAVGYSIARVPADDIVSLHEPERLASEPGPICCLGPGTGLGQVFAVHNSFRGIYDVFPSEGCMSEFVAKSTEEWEFRQWVVENTNTTPYIDVLVSGTGLFYWYRFLREKYPAELDKDLDESILSHEQPGSVIAAHGTPNTADASPLCVRAFDHFLITLGAEAGNMGLRFLARGGVFLAGGGMLAKNVARVRDGTVVRGFLGNGLAQSIVANCPLRMIVHGDLGMLGVEELASQLLNH